MNKSKALCENSTKHFVLKDYQQDGLQFLKNCYELHHGAILADEMGLGKTCQAIAFLEFLIASTVRAIKVLVICPLSVVDHWGEEIRRFSENLKTVVYYGNNEERQELRKKLKTVEWNLLLTTYELPLKDTDFFSEICWKCCVVDEGQRLKNDQSILHQILKKMNINLFLLLTGTPVQNDLSELYSLLSFADPVKFSADQKDHYIEKFRVWKDTDPEKLRKLLGNYMLRRTKELVCHLPEMQEIVLYHGLAAVQKNLYVAILMKNLGLVDQSLITKQRLLNTLMQLRKCVAHGYLFEGIEPEPFEEGDHLILNSGKMIVLDALLSYLHKTNHRVLIFSQMTRMLDIVQDYLTFRNYSYERLDGSVRGEERYASIKRFKQEQTFCFLLSTRAGGLGLTLTSADTVVFLDSDFNPQNDIQAAARAHRIGQEKPVKSIRLIAKDTVEEYILSKAYAKLQLTNTILNDSGSQNGASILSAAEISDLLMHGLAKLNKDQENFKMDESDIVRLIGPTDQETGLWQTNTKKKDSAELKLPANLDFYDFEGENYRKYREEDQEAFNALVTSSAEAKNQKRKITLLNDRSQSRETALTADEIERRKRALEQKRLSRFESQRKRLEAVKATKDLLWEKNNYRSTKLPELDSNDNDSRYSSDDDYDGHTDEEKSLSLDDQLTKCDINYVVGDVTKPDEKCGPSPVILHCLDNSGEWGSGGVFDALNRRFPQLASFYSKIKSMDDLHRGDVHIFEDDASSSCERPVDTARVALAVTQSAQNRDTLNYDTLESVLHKLSKYASENNYSVHMPRIGSGSLKFNWYTVERLIRKCLTDRSVPTYVYYYKKTRSTQEPDNDVRPGGSIDLGGKTSCYNLSDVRGKKRKSVLIEDDDGPISSTCSDEQSNGKHLANIFTGLTFSFRQLQPGIVERKLSRMITAFDGQTASTESDHKVTHVVDENAEVDKIELPDGKFVVSVKWLENCLRSKRLV